MIFYNLESLGFESRSFIESPSDPLQEATPKSRKLTHTKSSGHVEISVGQDPWNWHGIGKQVGRWGWRGICFHDFIPTQVKQGWNPVSLHGRVGWPMTTDHHHTQPSQFRMLLCNWSSLPTRMLPVWSPMSESTRPYLRHLDRNPRKLKLWICRSSWNPFLFAWRQ